MLDFIPFSSPQIGEAEIAEVVDTLRSGWLTTGKKTALFESKFTSKMNGNARAPVQSIAVNSATSGLHLALEAIGITEGSKVVVPTMTFTATAEVARYLGAEVILIDVDPKTLCMDIDQLKRVLELYAVDAVMPVHYGGAPCEMNEILQMCGDREVHVVEDAAHAFPSYYRGKIVGSLDSSATVFSFYANKTITTGEGGMVASAEQTLLDRMKIMRLHGIDRDSFARFTSTSKKPSWYYEVVAPGFKYNLTDIASSIGIHQLAKAEDMAWERRNIARLYDAAFKQFPLRVIECPSHSVSAQHLYVIQLDETDYHSRDGLVSHMLADSIGCSVHYMPLHMQPYWRDNAFKPFEMPVAETAFNNMVSLPLYSGMTPEQIQRVIVSVSSYFIGF